MEHHGEKYSTLESKFRRYSPDLSELEQGRIIIKTMQDCIDQDIFFALHFDELDQLRSEKDFKPWANFIVSLHDKIHSGCLGVFYVTQRDVHRIWEKDTRLKRLNYYFNFPYEPGSVYGDKIVDAFINLISLYQLANTTRFEPQSLELLESYLRQNVLELKTMKIREINILIYSFCTILDIMEQEKVWHTVETVKKLDRTQIGYKAERSLRALLHSLRIDFDYLDEKYSAEYQRQGISYKSVESDGKFVLSKMVGREFTSFLQLPIEIKYTSKGKHERDQLKKVETFLENYGTIFLSVGVKDDYIDRMKQQFKTPLDTKKLFLLNITLGLFEPILALPENGQNRKLAYAISRWFNQISKIRPELLIFLEAQAEVKEIATLREEMEQLKLLLRQVPAVQPAQTSISQFVPPPTTPAGSGLEQSLLYEIAIATVAVFEKTKSWKKRDTLNNHISKVFKTDIEGRDQLISKLIGYLASMSYLDTTKSIGRVYKTNKWDRQEVIECCKRDFKRILAS